jgi:hypothetical protein
MLGRPCQRTRIPIADPNVAHFDLNPANGKPWLSHRPRVSQSTAVDWSEEKVAFPRGFRPDKKT